MALKFRNYASFSPYECKQNEFCVLKFPTTATFPLIYKFQTIVSTKQIQFCAALTASVYNRKINMYKTQTTNERSENKKTRKQRSKSVLRNSSFSLSLSRSLLLTSESHSSRSVSTLCVHRSVWQRSLATRAFCCAQNSPSACFCASFMRSRSLAICPALSLPCCCWLAVNSASMAQKHGNHVHGTYLAVSHRVLSSTTPSCSRRKNQHGRVDFHLGEKHTLRHNENLWKAFSFAESFIPYGSFVYFYGVALHSTIFHKR